MCVCVLMPDILKVQFEEFVCKYTIYVSMVIHANSFFVFVFKLIVCVGVQDGGLAAVNQTVNKEAARAKVRKQVRTQHFSPPPPPPPVCLCVHVCVCVCGRGWGIILEKNLLLGFFVYICV